MRKLVAFGSVAVVALSLWLLASGLGEDRGAPPTTTDQRANPATAKPDAETANLTIASQTSTPAAKVSRTTVHTTVDTEDRVTQETTRVFGRMVHAGGAPLPDCTVKLNGWVGDHSRVQGFIRDHGPFPWLPLPAQSTDADGKFEFEFWPPPLRFALEVRHEGHVPLTHAWEELTPGDVVDLGDIVLPQGARVRGRVVDRLGNAHAGVRVALTRPTARVGKFESQASHAAVSRPDGSFEFENVLSAGTWNVGVRDEQLESPTTFVIGPNQRTADLEIFLIPDSEVETIRGVVVDGTGQPVVGAAVQYFPRARGRARKVSTSPDGSFRLERGIEDPVGPITIELGCNGYESFRSDEKFAWGRDDVRLVMRRGIDVSFRVIANATGEPVERFGINYREHPKSNARLGVAFNAQYPEDHPNGIATLKGLIRGRYLFTVDPHADSSLLSSRALDIEVRDPGVSQIEVRLVRATERSLRVVDAAGYPIPHTRVQLLEAIGDSQVGLDTLSLPPGHYSDTPGSQARSIADSPTDLFGTVQLAAAGDVTYSLRVLGPGHQPTVVQNIRLADVPDPWIVHVRPGATVRGRVDPAEFVRQLLTTDKRAHTRRWHDTPGMQLHRGEIVVPIGDPGGATIEPDGTFRFDDIPDGDWELVLRATGALAAGGPQTVATIQTLSAGEEREVSVDLHHLLRVPVRGRILLDGQPYTGRFQLLGTRAAHASTPGDDMTRVQGTSDAAGRFELLAWPGRIRAQVQDAGVSLQSDTTATAVLGAENEVEFDVRTGVARARLVFADGTAADGVQWYWKRAEAVSRHNPPRPQTTPTLEKRTSTGTYEVMIIPAGYDNSAGRASRTNSAAFEREMISAGTFEVPGNGEVAEFRVPERAGY